MKATIRGFFGGVKKYLMALTPWYRLLFASIFLGFLMIGFSIPTLSTRSQFNLVNIGLEVALALLCLLSFLYYKKIIIGPYVICLPVFCILVFVSFLANGLHHFSSSLFTISLVSIAFYLFLVQDKKNRQTAMFLFSVGLNFFLVFFAFFYRANLFSLPTSYENRVGTIFGNVNSVARYFAVTLLFDFYYAYKHKLYWRYALVVICFWFLLLTGSMSNLLISFLALFFSLQLFSKRKTKILSWIFLFVLFLSLFSILQIPALVYFKERIYGMIAGLFSVSSSGSGDASTSERLFLALEGFYLFLRRPIIGFGFDGITNNSFAGVYAHNNFAEIAGDFGIFALISYEFLLVWPLLLTKKSKQSDKMTRVLILGYLFLLQFAKPFYAEKFEHFLIALLQAAIIEDVPNLHRVIFDRRKEKLPIPNGGLYYYNL